MSYGKSIELFLVNGTAESIITAELSNWNGKAIKIPRIEVQDCKRNDIKNAGVYFLFCKEDDDSDSVYIGESENVQDRLVQHIRDNLNDREPYYWNTAVMFTGRDLNKAHIRYLEDRLVDIARNAKRYAVLTKNTFKHTKLSESQSATMEEFIDNIKTLISALGYKVLEPMIQKDKSSNSESKKLFLNIGNASATGMITSEGFVVLAGATINELTSKGFKESQIKNRQKIIDSDKVDNFKTVEDILFSSSSAAANFVLGYRVSGPISWNDKNGKTLKELGE